MDIRLRIFKRYCGSSPGVEVVRDWPFTLI